MITVQVNQKEYSITKEATVFYLLEHLKIETQGIAVAVNNLVVKKTDWSLQKLQQHDNVLIIKSTQGG